MNDTPRQLRKWASEMSMGYNLSSSKHSLLSTAAAEIERIERLEQLVYTLADALYRKDTEQDGNWGWPSFRDDVRRVRDTLKRK